ncbi:MAG: PKD domain-containing protein [Thermoplasmatota archaeon]
MQSCEKCCREARSRSTPRELGRSKLLSLLFCFFIAALFSLSSMSKVPTAGELHIEGKHPFGNPPKTLKDAGTVIGILENFTGGYEKGLPHNTYGFDEFNCLAVGDIDGDSNLDLAFGGEDYDTASTTGLYVYRGHGNGTWTSASSGLPTYNSWGGLAFGDADGDGKMELYACNEGWGSRGGSISGIGAWEYSSGSWSTTGITSPATSGYFNSIVLKNFTKGPGLDIAVTHSYGNMNGIKVFHSNGSSPIGWTSNSNGLPSSGEYAGIAVGDLNNDTLPDIAAVSYVNSGLRIFTQNALGNGWTDRSSSLPSSALSGRMLGVAIGDCNGDGHGDIIFTHRDNGMRMLLGNGGGASGTSFSWTAPTSAFPSNYGSSGRFPQIQLDDIDKDGDLDLMAPKAGNGLHLFLGNGTKLPGTGFGWTEVTNKNLPTNMTCYGSVFFDMDSDKDLDLAVATWGDGVKVFRTNLTLKDTNKAPVPDAGDDQTIRLGETAVLNGTGSSDPEDAPFGDTAGGLLNYDWNFTKVPAGSYVMDSSLQSSDKVAKPHFRPDVEGFYVLNLSVRDSKGKCSNRSDEDTVTVKVLNDAPVPDAGTGQTIYLGKTVYLNGTGSSDTEDCPEGDLNGTLLSYDWNVTSYPRGSLIRDGSLFPDDNSPTSHFVPDKVGKYRLTLAVNDSHGKWSHFSNESIVEITVVKPNDPPIPDAGVDITRFTNTFVYLNGSKSRDVDGEIVHWNWTCSNESIDLTFEDSSHPFFYPFEPGNFTFTLNVQDDNGSWADLEDEVNVTIIEPGRNLPPSADAGGDIHVVLGEEVVLDGTASSDLDGEILIWDWRCTSHPGLMLNATNSSRPHFAPAETGIYGFTLRVMDDNGSWSPEDGMLVYVSEPFLNQRPFADAGSDIYGFVSEELSLDGRNSYDLDGLVVKYNWTCLDGYVNMIGWNTSRPHFSSSEPCILTFSLMVMDDMGEWSLPDTVNATIWQRPSPPPDQGPKNVTFSIGPLLYENGYPVPDAVMTMTALDLWPWQTPPFFNSTSTQAGMFHFFQGIPPGNYSSSIIIDGETPVPPFDVLVLGNGTVIIPGGLPTIPSPVPVDDDDVDDDVGPVDDDIVDDDIDDDDIGPVDDDIVDDDVVDDAVDDDDGIIGERGMSAYQVAVVALVGSVFVLITVVVIIGYLRREKEDKVEQEDLMEKYLEE